jgi:hypothetical protein
MSVGPRAAVTWTIGKPGKKLERKLTVDFERP